MDAIKSKIVLAGDPMQLDPVYTSNHAKTLAEKFGYCTSLMGYLFNRTCYKSEFNSKLIVQLKKNYRSHRSILHIPNALFYEGLLECEGQKRKLTKCKL